MSNLAPLRETEKVTYLKVNELPSGTFRGIFRNSRDGEFGKTHFFTSNDAFKSSIKTKDGNVEVNVQEGEIIGINGTSTLDWSMEHAENGMEIQIDWKGKKSEVSKEGKKYTKHVVEVNRVSSF